MSRWLLERTAQLVGGSFASVLRAAAAGAPLPKPADHRGGEETDMFEVRLQPGTAVALLRRVREEAGLAPNEAPTGRLRGVVIAWQEHCAALAPLRPAQVLDAAARQDSARSNRAGAPPNGAAQNERSG